jgi:hypothetical protein
VGQLLYRHYKIKELQGSSQFVKKKFKLSSFILGKNLTLFFISNDLPLFEVESFCEELGFLGVYCPSQHILFTNIMTVRLKWVKKSQRVITKSQVKPCPWVCV